MGFIIKNDKVQKAKKVVLSSSDRKIVFTQTSKQKEILQKANERRLKAETTRIKAVAFGGE